MWWLFDFMLQCWWWISSCHLLFWKWTLLEGLSTRLFISFCKYFGNPFRTLLLCLLEFKELSFISVFCHYILLMCHGCRPFLKYCSSFLFEIALQLQILISVHTGKVAIYSIWWDVEHILLLKSITFLKTAFC